MPDHMQVIVKVAERCNLNCAYCYMYAGPDQSWRARPALMSAATRQLLVERCREHLATSDDAQITLEFHGGEPLLLGKPAFAELLGALREAIPPERCPLCIQTNGTLLDDEWCALFEEYGMCWSISCDGPPKIHDRFRVYHSGATSSAAVERAIRLSIARDSPLFCGVLAVVDPSSSGPAIVRYFHELGVRKLDLLLPDANHAAAPAHLPRYSQAALTEFMKQSFDAWIGLGDAEFRIRLFEEIMRGLFGRRSGLDAFGGNLWGMLVVESDGSYQLLDVLRIGGTDEVATDLDLARHSLADYLERTRDRFPAPCAECTACPVFAVCGGGYLPHRFDGRDYDRPSVHCATLFALIGHIRSYLQAVTPEALWQRGAGAASPAALAASEGATL